MTDDSSGGLCCICLRECQSHSCTVCNKPCHPFPLCGRPVVEGYGGGVLCAKCDPENKGIIEENAIVGKSAEKIQGELAVALLTSLIFPCFSSMKIVFCYTEEEIRNWTAVDLNTYSCVTVAHPIFQP